MPTEASLKETVVGMLLTIVVVAMVYFMAYETGKASVMIERQKMMMEASDDGWKAGSIWTRHMIEKDGDERCLQVER